jgi:hypothetical protein
MTWAHWPLVAPFLLAPSIVLADPPSLQDAIGNPDDLKVAASIRARYETLDGQPRVGFRAHDRQLALRSTILAEYHDGPFRIGGELYDSRVYLDRAGSAVTANEVNTMELVQAYVAGDFRNAFGPGTLAQVQVGRMTLNLGSRRLVAADDYRNTTNGYTGIRADVRTRDGLTATLIYTLPQLRLPDDLTSVRKGRTAWDRESFDLRLWGGIVARPATIAGAAVEIGYFRLQERDGPGRATRDRDLHTLSTRIIRDPKPGRADFEVEGIYQFGGISSGLATAAPRLPVEAWFIHADAGYSVPGPAALRVSIEYDQASGDSRGRTYRRFDTLFGMRRADLAPAGIYNAVGRANILTPGLRVEVAPAKRFDAFAVYRAMWLANRTDAFSTTGIRDATGRSGRFAGHQLEARMRYWLVPRFLRTEINALWLAKARALTQAPNAPQSGDTHYLSMGATMTL